jgi:hypothetical protein
MHVCQAPVPQLAQLASLALLTTLMACGSAPPAARDAILPADPRVAVRVQTDQADAVLDVLARRARGEHPADEHWQQVFETEAYRRLARREAAMGRAFEDAAFREFLGRDSMLARLPRLAATLAEWKRIDIAAAARVALAYLPADATIRATMYPVIKPQSNSFVFETRTDSPAIFMFLDPDVSAAKLANTLAHELHHIGHSAACTDAPEPAAPEPVRQALLWSGAFGEGLAMLAAAGGPDRHPHAVSDAADRERCDREVANVAQDMRTLERFFLDVAEGRLADADSVRSAAMNFFGEQGPWYTVGWVMASTVERVHGRQRLIDHLCEPARLLRDYNTAAAEQNRAGATLLPLWSETLLSRLGV